MLSVVGSAVCATQLQHACLQPASLSARGGGAAWPFLPREQVDGL